MSNARMNPIQKARKIRKATEILSRCRQADVRPPAWVRSLLKIR